MGYRTYIYSIPKREYNKIKSMSPNQLVDFYNIEVEEDGHWYRGVYEFGQELYEFGKYTDFNPPKKSHSPFFKNKETRGRYEEYNFEVVTKDFLAYIIDTYKDEVKSHYNNMLLPFFGDKPSKFLNSLKTEYEYPEKNYKFDFTKITQEEQNSMFKIIEHIRGMRTEWTQLTPFNLENEQSITTSWKYEYGIFELVRIYKSFDWKRNIMYYAGW